jgi:hypothetical protein
MRAHSVAGWTVAQLRRRVNGRAEIERAEEKISSRAAFGAEENRRRGNQQQCGGDDQRRMKAEGQAVAPPTSEPNSATPRTLPVCRVELSTPAATPERDFSTLPSSVEVSGGARRPRPLPTAIN